MSVLDYIGRFVANLLPRSRHTPFDGAPQHASRPMTMSAGVLVSFSNGRSR